jgi:hypothetical protein
VRRKSLPSAVANRKAKSNCDTAKYTAQTRALKDIEARTITPDGQIVELKKDDIFERTEVKTSGVKGK